MNENEYIDCLVTINKNLRDQVETLYKLLKMKIKTEGNNTRLNTYIEEMEILKSSLSLNLEKSSLIVSIVY
jgi:hypothetical protein